MTSYKRYFFEKKLDDTILKNKIQKIFPFPVQRITAQSEAKRFPNLGRTGTKECKLTNRNAVKITNERKLTSSVAVQQTKQAVNLK